MGNKFLIVSGKNVYYEEYKTRSNWGKKNREDKRIREEMRNFSSMEKRNEAKRPSKEGK